MEDNTWVMNIEGRVLSIVKSKCEKANTKLFSSANFTSVDENINSNTKFPTIYIGEMNGGTEVGKDLEGKSINGIMSTFEVRVSTNTSKSDAKKVMGYVLNAFKDLSFNNVSMPITTSINGVYQCTARFRRVIGASDKL